MTPTIFFDGVCGLCNGFVDFMLRRGAAGRVRCAPLQGETAARELAPERLRDLDTVVLKCGESVSMKSSAILRAIGLLPGPWPAIKIFLIVPPPIRDFVYDFIATRRYGWFGKRDACRMPTAEERSLFLP